MVTTTTSVVNVDSNRSANLSAKTIRGPLYCVLRKIHPHLTEAPAVRISDYVLWNAAAFGK